MTMSRDPVTATLQGLTQKVAELQRLYERLKGREAIPITNWTTWTPTITQSGSVTFTNTYCRYMVIEKLVHVTGVLAVTSAGTANNVIAVGSLPAAIGLPGAGYPLGVGLVLNQTTAYYMGAMLSQSATSFAFVVHNDPTVAGNYIGANPNFALASGDIIYFNGAWEIA